ncbi:MAG: hypothetical protein RMI04_09260 [Thermofilaceae archaeon]|nr:hypothetical protein [Thermofilaceae archaeon]
MSAPQLSGFEPLLPPELEVTPGLVSAALKRAIRYGVFWRLKPEERAILFLARKLKSIKSPLLREVIVKIFSRVWPEKAKLYEAFNFGIQIIARRIEAALKVGARKVTEYYSKLNPRAILQLGLTTMNTPLFYRDK